MTKVRLKYLHSFVDRHGHVRYYFRYRGNRWTLPGPHEEGFATAYDALLTQIRANPIPLKNSIAFMRGSLGWVIEQFIASPAYQTRAEATKRNYRRVIDALKQRYGTGLMKDMQPKHVKTIRNDIRDAWPQDLIARFMAEASPRLGFAVRLALGTGLRRSDLVKLKWQDLRGDNIAVNHQKTGASWWDALRNCLRNWQRCRALPIRSLWATVAIPLRRQV